MTDEQPTIYKDCGRIYSECKIPGQQTFDGGEDFPDKDDTENEISSFETTDEPEITTTTARSLPKGKLILKRRKNILRMNDY